MSSAVKTAVTIGIFGSALATVVSLVVVISLFNEINTMYDETMLDLGEFKEIANDAWKTMMTQRRPAFDSMFRQKRQYGGADAGQGAAGSGVTSPQATTGASAGYGGPASAATGGETASSGGSQCKCAQQASKCPAGPPGL
jgi:hypothetical protein